MTNTAYSLPVAAPAELGFAPQRIKLLLDVLQDEINRKRLPGCVALIARHGKLALFESLGWQQASTDTEVPQTPMATDSIFRIYSMTKPIVSVALMMLYEQGKVLLGDPVAKYLPEFADQKVLATVDGVDTLRPVIRRATVQDVLRHTAGLTYEFLGADAVHKQYAQARMGTRERSNAEFMPALAALPLVAEPGTVWEYSRATDVVGRLVEVLSGQTLGAYLKEKLFTPLGMTQTAFSVAPELHSKIAEPFAKDPEGAPQMKVFDVRLPVAFESGGGGLASTAMDYARFMQ